MGKITNRSLKKENFTYLQHKMSQEKRGEINIIEKADCY